MVGRSIPRGFIEGPGTTRFIVLCEKERGRLRAVYHKHKKELRLLAEYRQFLADLAREALTEMEGGE